MLRDLSPPPTDDNADYQQWQFETYKAEWEGEQETLPDLYALPRLFSHLAHHGMKRQLVRLGKCRRCGYSENAIE